MYRFKLSPTFSSLIGSCVMLLWAGGCGTEVGGHGEIEERTRVSAALSSATDQDIAGGLPLAKITLTVDVDAGAQNSLSGTQMRISSSHPAFLAASSAAPLWLAAR